jgi:hypothetical protein
MVNDNTFLTFDEVTFYKVVKYQDQKGETHIGLVKEDINSHKFTEYLEQASGLANRGPNSKKWMLDKVMSSSKSNNNASAVHYNENFSDRSVAKEKDFVSYYNSMNFEDKINPQKVEDTCNFLMNNGHYANSKHGLHDDDEEEFEDADGNA